jgi:DNA replication protein DnaC
MRCDAMRQPDEDGEGLHILITSQLDPKKWHPVIGDETIANAVCDRLVHNAHKLKLGGESIRKTKSDLTKGQKPAK